MALQTLLLPFILLGIHLLNPDYKNQKKEKQKLYMS
jgi:hypothetical protein